MTEIPAENPKTVLVTDWHWHGTSKTLIKLDGWRNKLSDMITLYFQNCKLLRCMGPQISSSSAQNHPILGSIILSHSHTHTWCFTRIILPFNLLFWEICVCWDKPIWLWPQEILPQITILALMTEAMTNHSVWGSYQPGPINFWLINVITHKNCRGGFLPRRDRILSHGHKGLNLGLTDFGSFSIYNQFINFLGTFFSHFVA